MVEICLGSSPGYEPADNNQFLDGPHHKRVSFVAVLSVLHQLLIENEYS